MSPYYRKAGFPSSLPAIAAPTFLQLRPLLFLVSGDVVSLLLCSKLCGSLDPVWTPFNSLTEEKPSEPSLGVAYQFILPSGSRAAVEPKQRSRESC